MDPSSAIKRALDPNQRVLEMDSGHAIVDATREHALDLCVKEPELVSDERPDVGLSDVKIAVERRIVVPPHP